ncbi:MULTISPECIES: SDR family NAD(P)-dependent oxidoreductase [Marinobacter]|uniref:SDR family NAD(P)-dependent oxidoreductase n=1 Tax=Marinobacter TaxID=2742 RepID=UPI000DAEB5B4|nr:MULTISPECIES: SDR family NAD(P)-dependent oxidoreductase [Marinobacter]
MEIDQSVIVVTGGSSGLGAATVRHLAYLGARVAILARGEERARQLASDVGGIAVPCDVRDPRQTERAYHRVRDELGPMAAVINCAGVGTAEKILRKGEAMALERFSGVVETNLIGTFNSLRLAAAIMKDREHNADSERGVIINTASIAAFDGQSSQAAYAASKGGIVALTLPAARELGAYGIRVNTIAPGLFATPMTERLPQTVKDGIAGQSAFPARFGRPLEFARLVQQVIENPMINGETIRLDGGLRMPN